MANLPPRPVFTNLGDGAPTFNNRGRACNPPGSMGPGSSSDPRHYHPYERRANTSAQGTPHGTRWPTIPPWRRKGAQHKPQPTFPGHSYHHQPQTPFTSGTNYTSHQPAVNANSSPPRQPGVQWGSPAEYAVDKSMVSYSRSIVSTISYPVSGASSDGTTAPSTSEGVMSPASRRRRRSGINKSPCPLATASPGRDESVFSDSASQVMIEPTSGRQPRPSDLPSSTSRATPTITTATTSATTATTKTIKTTILLAPTADDATTLAITLGPCHRTFLVAAPVGRHFAATWSRTITAISTSTSPSYPDKNENNDNNNDNIHNTSRVAIDLTARIPGAATWPRDECEAHLGALYALLRAMHDGDFNQGSGVVDVDIDVLWRLGRLHQFRSFDGGLVDDDWGVMTRLREQVMGRLIAASVAEWRRWIDCWWPAASLAMNKGVRKGVAAGTVTETLERAAEACLAFGWTDEFRAVVGRMAYVCRVGEDGERGQGVLVGPDERRVRCASMVIDTIVDTRNHVLDRVLAAAQQSLLKWTVGIGCHPCANMTCNTNRIAALNVFLLWSGLYPRSRMNKSLLEIISGLQYITATDAELSANAKNNGWKGGQVDDRLLWAAHIRENYGGTCAKCKEKTPTSMLFPLEDLLCDVTFEMQEGFVESEGGVVSGASSPSWEDFPDMRAGMK